MDISYSINSYDADGDIVEGGFFLHFGEVRIKVADNVHELQNVVDKIVDCRTQIYADLRSI